MSSHQWDEGHTRAGWTGFWIAVVGTVGVGLAVVTTSVLLAVAGLAVVVLSLVVTWVMHLGGWGKGPGGRPREQWPMRVRDPLARAGHSGCLGCRLARRGG